MEIYKLFKDGIEADAKDLSAEDMGRIYLGVGDEPVYSPTGEKVAFLKSQEIGGYEKDTVRLKDIRTQETKTILENVSLDLTRASSILIWSKDGGLLLVLSTTKNFVFSKEGDQIFEGTSEEVANKFGNIFIRSN
jgi:hypothetical protein